ncbi:MAG: AAA family ATPase [Pseudomonadota bacterium]
MRETKSANGMYTEYFGLSEKPFTITPDPRYLFMSERHSEALAHLMYGINESDGFVQLTGEVGTGKTTLIRSMFLQLSEKADIALILNPQLSPREFLAAIAGELDIPGIGDDDSLKTLLDSLTKHLVTSHAAGRRTILVVDEAQLLSVDVLEQVRMLTNLETARQKLLQIILIGQPELRELLARNDLRQLAQRITARYHLQPLTNSEVGQYIDHRLKVAGALGELFAPAAKREVYKRSRGIPRLVNVLCDRALLGAYVREQPKVTARLVGEAAREVSGEPSSSSAGNWWLSGLAAVAALIVVAGAWSFVKFAGEQREIQPVTESEPLQIARAEPLQPTVTVPPATSSADDSESVEPEVQPIDLPALLRANQDRTGTASAFAALFAEWQVPVPDAGAPCESAATELGLRCLYLRGSWGIVRQLDRPAILTLTDQNGDSHQVVLTRIYDDRATLRIADQQLDVSQSAVSDLWFGESLLLWRPPNGEAKSFVPGMNDPGIQWLRQSLATIQLGPVVNPDSTLYDQALEQRVRDYQRTRRLKVDGVVGQQTQIIINSDLGLDGIPRLTDSRS